MQKFAAYVTLVISILFSIQGAEAKVYWLPDFLDENLDRNGQRVSEPVEGDRPEAIRTCETYGLISAINLPTDGECVVANSPLAGLECYKCTSCSSVYAYDSSNCSGDYVVSGNSCGGKYNKCICNPAKYPAASTGDGCLEGETVDTSRSCTNKSDGQTAYQCVEDPCYDLISEDVCESSGKYCVISSSCPGKCESCDADTCSWPENAGYSSCDNGCDTNGSIDGCPSKCKTGCKAISCDEPAYVLSGDTCIPNPCPGYDLDTCPEGTDCDVCPSGDGFKYMAWGCLIDQGYMPRPDSPIRGDCQCIYGTNGCYCDSNEYPYESVPQNSCLLGNCGFMVYNYYSASCRSGTSYDKSSNSCICRRNLSGKVVEVTTAEELIEAGESDADIIVVKNNIKMFTYESLRITNKLLVGPNYDKCIISEPNPVVRMMVPQSIDGTNACMVLTNSTVSHLNLECANYINGSFKKGIITEGDNTIENSSIRFSVAERLGHSPTSMFANGLGTLTLNGDVQLSVGFRNVANANNQVVLFESKERMQDGTIPETFGKVVSGSPCSTLNISFSNVPPEQSFGLNSAYIVGIQEFDYAGPFAITSDSVRIGVNYNMSIGKIVFGGDGVIKGGSTTNVEIGGIISNGDLYISGNSVTLINSELNGTVDIAGNSIRADGNTLGAKGVINEGVSAPTNNQCLGLAAISLNPEAGQSAPSGTRQEMPMASQTCYLDICNGYISSNEASQQDICDLGNENVYTCPGPGGVIYFACMYKY